ncbi:MAG: polymer-forming cytoskeletal protein [Phycisphaerae bacterium]
MRGRSALAVERALLVQNGAGLGGVSGGSGMNSEGSETDSARISPEFGEVLPGVERFKTVTENIKTTRRAVREPRPERCCVHCGFGMYIPRGAQRVRCPKCCNDVSVVDVTLTGDVVEEQIVTAGKIVVEADARVAAKLVASSVEIAGRVLGDVLASNVCTIMETGKQAGKILCRRLDLRPGAEIDGAIELIRDEG